VTARAAITQAVIDRAARVAKAQGVVVTITTADGTTCTIAPVGEKAKGDDFDLVDMKR
jgi:polysaccharide deacetylase 2 family uncharacterized protein YibQ